MDDLIIVPLGTALALKMIPAEVLAECQEKSREVMKQGKPANRAAAAALIVIWLLLAALAIRFVAGFIAR